MKLSEKIFNAWNMGEEVGTPPELAREAAALEARVAELEAILRRVDDYFQRTGKVGDLPVSVHALLPRPHACSRRNAAP